MTRYALYFAPRLDSPWWKAGCQWLGRDAADDAEAGQPMMQPEIDGLPRLSLAKLTSDARRYGFHATLKAPFRLQGGFTETHLTAMAEAFCAVQKPLFVPDVEVGMMGNALALRATGDSHLIDELALRCVQYFDPLRAAPTAEEQRKYRSRGLSAREEELLQRWGYPYTEDRFRFHMSLSDDLAELDAGSVAAMRAAAQAHFAHARATEPLGIDGLTIFREIERGTPFQVWKRFAFSPKARRSSLPRAGRLYYFVGAQGVRREVLLRWVRKHMPTDGDIVFAQHTITRPAQACESHEPVNEATFWQLASDGHFAMIWQADGLCYGIRRGIEVDLRIGRDVVVNGAPEYVEPLRRKFPEAQVIWFDGADGERTAGGAENVAPQSMLSAVLQDRSGAPDCGVSRPVSS
jgi:ribose 1,5-bisphosphokinase